MKTLLTIAGFDPSSGAGVTADLMVFAAEGFFGTAAITALTVQSTLGVQSTQPVSPEHLQATLRCLRDDLPPDGIKIGMLGTEGNVEVAAEFISECKAAWSDVPIVLDPVFQSSSGRELLSEAGVTRLRQSLLPLVDWVTPNLQELAQLADLPVRTPSEMEAAVRKLQARLPSLSVVATGGHLVSADDLVAARGGQMRWLQAPKIVSQATHGTGCAHSSALLCALANGLGAFEAATAAKHFVTQAIQRAEPLGHGRGPMNLLWPLR